jgi:hypothetical protein
MFISGYFYILVSCSKDTNHSLMFVSAMCCITPTTKEAFCSTTLATGRRRSLSTLSAFGFKQPSTEALNPNLVFVVFNHCPYLNENIL